MLTTKLVVWLFLQLRSLQECHSHLFSPEQWPSDLRVPQNQLGRLLKDRLLGPTPRLSDSVYLG